MKRHPVKAHRPLPYPTRAALLAGAAAGLALGMTGCSPSQAASPGKGETLKSATNAVVHPRAAGGIKAVELGQIPTVVPPTNAVVQPRLPGEIAPPKTMGVPPPPAPKTRGEIPAVAPTPKQSAKLPAAVAPVPMIDGDIAVVEP